MTDPRRTLAFAIFRRAEDLVSLVQDFEAAKGLLNQRLIAGDVHPAIRELDNAGRAELNESLSATQTWPELLHHIGENTLLSRDAEASAFGDVAEFWARLRGFDVDGLLVIGDSAAAEQPRDRGILPRYELAASAHRNWSAD